MPSIRAVLRNLGLAMLPAAAVVRAAYLSRYRLPASRPRWFVARRLRRPGAKVVACLGDSLTQGSVSDDYVARLENRLSTEGFQFVNAGVNGDLSYNVRVRVPEVLACEPDAAVVLAGINDVLASLGPEHTANYRRTKELPRDPSLGWYRENLREITSTLLSKARCPVALLSLPPLGGTLQGRANCIVSEYNAVIREVALEHRVRYLPLHEKMLELLGVRNGDGQGEFEFVMGPLIRAAARRYLLGQSWNAVAASQGYQLLTDGIHLSSISGALVADLVEGFLREVFRPVD